MKQLIVWSLAISFSLAFGNPAIAKKKKEEMKQMSGFPSAYTSSVAGAKRFDTPAYFSLMASDGIRKVDPKILYGRLQAAVAANERYKALYLARILTDLKPDVAATWSNRAKLAADLGLSEEAAACNRNAKTPGSRVDVPLTDILPGAGLQIKPATLSDWAAATALLADGIAEKAGPQALVAFKDSVSGIHEATPEQVAEHDRADKAAGLNPTGRWADPSPVQLRHVLGNVFELTKAEPMHYHSVNKGSMFGAYVFAGLGALQQGTNPMGAEQSRQTGEIMAGQASQVASLYKGGSYTEIVFNGGHENAIPDHPQATGKSNSVGNPLPFLWGSGRSTNPYFSGDWDSTQKIKVQKISATNLNDIGDPHEKRFTPPKQLQFPKLMELRIMIDTELEASSGPLSLMEVLLTAEDVSAIAPGLRGSVVDLERFRQAYDTPQLVLAVDNGGGSLIWGVDKAGAMYGLEPGPTAWLVAAQ